jgi:hypothetical protein
MKRKIIKKYENMRDMKRIMFRWIYNIMITKSILYEFLLVMMGHMYIWDEFKYFIDLK